MSNDYSDLKRTQEILHNLQEESQNKYIFYLLAVAAAAIAFAIHSTSTSALAFSQIPLGIAVIFWGLSFYNGCKCAEHAIDRIGINWKLVSLNDPSYNDMSKTIENYNEGKKRLDKKGTEIYDYRAKQFKLLIIGAIFFIIWHLIEMGLRLQYT